MTDVGQYALPADATAPGTARTCVRSWLRVRDLQGLADSAVLLVSELVTNAVLHADGPLELTLSPAGAGIRIALSDRSRSGPSPRRHSHEATTGRGLRLVAELADEWGWEPLGDGKVVWCTVSAATDPWAAYAGDTWAAEAER